MRSEINDMERVMSKKDAIIKELSEGSALQDRSSQATHGNSHEHSGSRKNSIVDDVPAATTHGDSGNPVPVREPEPISAAPEVGVVRQSSATPTAATPGVAEKHVELQADAAISPAQKKGDMSSTSEGPAPSLLGLAEDPARPEAATSVSAAPSVGSVSSSSMAPASAMTEAVEKKAPHDAELAISPKPDMGGAGPKIVEPAQPVSGAMEKAIQPKPAEAISPAPTTAGTSSNNAAAAPAAAGNVEEAAQLKRADAVPLAPKDAPASSASMAPTPSTSGIGGNAALSRSSRTISQASRTGGLRSVATAGPAQLANRWRNSAGGMDLAFKASNETPPTPKSKQAPKNPRISTPAVAPTSNIFGNLAPSSFDFSTPASSGATSRVSIASEPAATIAQASPRLDEPVQPPLQIDPALDTTVSSDVLASQTTNTQAAASSTALGQESLPTAVGLDPPVSDGSPRTETTASSTPQSVDTTQSEPPAVASPTPTTSNIAPSSSAPEPATPSTSGEAWAAPAGGFNFAGPPTGPADRPSHGAQQRRGQPTPALRSTGNARNIRRNPDGSPMGMASQAKSAPCEKCGTIGHPLLPCKACKHLKPRPQ